MLKPDYFDWKSEKMLELYRQLEDWILKDIANRLLTAGEMSGTADRLIWKLQQMGESRDEIFSKLQQMTKLSKRELKALLQDAVMTSWADDRDVYKQMGIEISSPLENATVMRIMDAEYKKSLTTLDNLTRTTMEKSQKDLMNLLDEVELRTGSGVQSYSAAVCEVLDRYAGKGIEVTYPTGAVLSLESAVNLIVRTSLNQTTAQVTNQYIKEAETNYVLVSAHYGARVAQKGQPPLADHSAWQGKPYSIRGSEPGYPNLLESTGYDILPDGTGKVVDPLGLHGYNCRHSHQPWDKSLRNPWVDENGKPIIDNEKSRKMYEDNQKARAMERAIRKTKRELLMKEEEMKNPGDTDKQKLKADYDRLSYKLRQQNGRYNEFCEQNDVPKQHERIKVAGFKVAQSRKANGAATRYQNGKEAVANFNEDDTIKSNTSKLTFNQEYEQHKNQISEKLHDVETERRSLNYEVGTILDRTGNVINVTGGEAHSVSPPTELLKDNIFTHNHPGGGCFSHQDLESMIDCKLLELRASTPQGTYFSLLRKEGTNLVDHVFSDEYKQASGISKAMEEINELLRSKKISADDIKKEGFSYYLRYQSELGRKWLKEHAEEFGYIYSEGEI